jgi:penicillin amidase
MRVLKAVPFLIALLLTGVLGVFLWYRQASLPVHEGTLKTAGLAQPVKIVRDATGVPHIVAASEADALYALGFVHAQDRLWQMDFARRIANGRVAQIAGPAAVDTDRFLRILGIQRAAQRIVTHLDPETRALVEAYANGVNAYLALSERPLPPEFQLTRAPAPAPWTAADSVAWSLMLAWDLSSSSFRNELARLRLSTRLTRAEIDEFKPPYPGDPPMRIADYPQMYRVLGLRKSAAVAALQHLAQATVPGPADDAIAIGSNNWVVSGAHTRSGKPLLANDPHLGLTTPSLWYMAHLQAPGIDVQGATLPGVPYVLIGRNRGVAWGFTNTGPDVQDLYIERIDPSDPTHYMTPTGSAAFALREEVIEVKGEAPVPFTVRETRHGPVVSDASGAPHKAVAEGSDGAGVVLALRWTALEPEDHSLRALRAMNRAVDAAGFERALRDLTVATQNVVFADVHGTIGFVVAGRIPLRAADNDLMGMAPAPGWDARYDWQGWIPFEQLPRSIDPPGGVLVTANQKVVPPGYRHHLTADWYLPYRAERIAQRIAAVERHDLASLQAIQRDVRSQAALDVLQRLRETRPATPAGRLALDRLLAWDGETRPDAPEPLLLQAWLQRLRQRIFADDLGPLADDYVAPAELTRTLLNTLDGRNTARDWCDDITTSERHETCAELAAESLDDAVGELVRATGRDPSGLRWGDVHKAVFEHRPLSAVGALRRMFESRTTVGGDTFTVNVASMLLRGDEPFNSTHAPSWRAVFDLADDHSGAMILAPGQVGNPFSSHYDDLLDDWRTNTLRPLVWTPPRGAPTLVLQPRAATPARPLPDGR